MSSPEEAFEAIELDHWGIICEPIFLGTVPRRRKVVVSFLYIASCFGVSVFGDSEQKALFPQLTRSEIEKKAALFVS